MEDVLFSSKTTELSSGTVNGLGVQTIHPLLPEEGGVVPPLTGRAPRIEACPEPKEGHFSQYDPNLPPSGNGEHIQRLSRCFVTFEA